MTSETRADGAVEALDPEQLLQRWTGRLPYRLLLLDKVLLPDGEWFDFTPGSLDALERELLRRFGPSAPPPPASDGPGASDASRTPVRAEWTEWTESAAAYVGEVLLGVAGGAWGWHTRPVDGAPGQPVVCPDAELGLSPLAPKLLIAHALRGGSGGAFAAEVARLRAAVAALAEQVPGWSPVKAHTPQVDPVGPLAEHPFLARWTAERREALSDWSEEAFRGAWRWNFHPGTLDLLESVVRERFATVEEFDASRDEPFVQGACWYLGEVIRRNFGAMWQYAPLDAAAEPGALGSREHGWTGVPFVDQPGKRLPGAAEPLGCLRELLAEPEPGRPAESLRDVLFWFRPSTYAYVGEVLADIGMVPAARVAEVLDDFAPWAHDPMDDPSWVFDALQSFGVAVSAHGDDVDDLEESYAHLLDEAAALTGGAVTITDVRLRRDGADGEGGEGGEGGESLEFRRNGVLVSESVDHLSDRYLDHLAVPEIVGHVDPDPEVDRRRFRVGDHVRLQDGGGDTFMVFATDEQAELLEKALGVELH
ncbi:hypothetical protein QIS99_15545 [Streptomyces sp. B-S-A8]|uniref:Uncharacterized protein n=1 Tax=Streptomyces solicavernae TaxID=3043614 RepID=A0ABT6RT51_9ACTN|nr:hypothetical protein [Streptomyces sp. B-S-A8]MDI3387604.1 hypothetical protein [Streptomyces sp. B-S-A8]